MIAQPAPRRRRAGAVDLEERVPPGVREAIVTRLARLGPDAGLLLAAAAVVGRHADLDLLRHVVQLSEDTGLAALEEALATGLLREVAEDAYACAHDTIRDVVYTETGAHAGDPLDDELSHVGLLGTQP